MRVTLILNAAECVLSSLFCCSFNSASGKSRIAVPRETSVCLWGCLLETLWPGLHDMVSQTGTFEDNANVWVPREERLAAWLLSGIIPPTPPRC